MRGRAQSEPAQKKKTRKKEKKGEKTKKKEDEQKKRDLLVSQLLESDTVDHINRVNNVTKGLGHLSAVLVTNHSMQEHLIKGKLVRQLQGHHHHPSYPEEENIVAGLQELPGEEGFEVGIFFVGPVHGGKGEQTRGEPSVQNVRILFNGQFVGSGAEALAGDLGSFFNSFRYNPVFFLIGSCCIGILCCL